MCYLAYNSSKGLVIYDDYVLVAIMTTLCITSRNDFLIYNTKNCLIERWDSTDIIKNFWCVPEKPVADIDELYRKRLQFFDKYQWIYDDLRCVPRDTHNPGNKSDNFKTKNYKAAATMWKLYKGPRQVLLQTPIIMPSTSGFLSRSARLLENAKIAKLAEEKSIQEEKERKKAISSQRIEAKRRSDQENRLKFAEEKIAKELQENRQLRSELDKEKQQSQKRGGITSDKQNNNSSYINISSNNNTNDIYDNNNNKRSFLDAQLYSRDLTTRYLEEPARESISERRERLDNEERIYEENRQKRRLEELRERERSQERRIEKERDRRHQREMSEERYREKAKRYNGNLLA